MHFELDWSYQQWGHLQNQSQQFYEKQGFIPSMESPCEKKNMHYKFLTKKTIFGFPVNYKIKRLMESPNE